jgi:cytochrome P450
MGRPAHVPEELVRDYNLDRRISVEEHLRGVAVLRSDCPVSYSEHPGALGLVSRSGDEGTWVVTTYDDIAEILRGWNIFSSAQDGDAIGPFSRLIPINLDGAEHREYRHLLNPLFSPPMAAGLEPSMRQLANQLIDKFIDQGGCEFVSEFARPLPGTLFLRMMGWPVEDADVFYGWVDVLLSGVPNVTPEDSLVLRKKAAEEQTAYIAAMIEARRREPTDDLTTALINSTVDGHLISDQDLYGMFFLLMLGGLDTVQSVLGQSFAYLAEHPDFRDQMMSPDLLPTAVEELLRWTSPAMAARKATEQTKIGGIEIRADEKIYCPMGAANRDPKYYSDPDTPRLDRHSPKPHLSFGLGPHRCLGSHIARAELKVAFEEWHRRIPEYRISSGGLGNWHLGVVWGVDALRLEF